MNIFIIHTPRRNQKGDCVYMHFGCDLSTVEEFARKLTAGEFVVGTQVWVMKAEDEVGPYLDIYRTRDVALGPLGVISIATSNDRYVLKEIENEIASAVD